MKDIKCREIDKILKDIIDIDDISKLANPYCFNINLEFQLRDGLWNKMKGGTLNERLQAQEKNMGPFGLAL